MSTRLKSLRKGYRENRASALAALGLLLFAISLLMYELLREPPQYLEFHGFYEGLRTVTHGGRYGSHKELYLKVQGLDRPIKAVDGWDRIKRMKLNRLVHFVVEPKSRWFFEPRVYYEAVAITANITVYDHRQEREERQRARLKSLLLLGGFATVLLLMFLHAARNGTGQRASRSPDGPEQTRTDTSP